MDLAQLDAEVCRFCHLGLAPSTHKASKAAVNRFSLFCAKFGFNDPFPVNESLLCRFVASLAQEGLALNTIKTYLAGIRHAQVIKGLPEPRQLDSMPWLRLLQSGVGRNRVAQGVPPARQRLPITLPMLRAMLDIWTATPNSESSSHSFNLAMLWAAASTCFFGFFRSGEITVPSRSTFDPLIHLAWGDVTVDGSSPPSSVRIHLKRSKCDQLGRGVNIFLGRSGSPTCPMEEIIRYVLLRGPAPGPFFWLADGSPLTKAAFVRHVRSALTTMGLGALVRRT